jgi:hypothetical protein
METKRQMVFQKSWEEFRATGLLWWINHTLHLFGWSIVVEAELNQDGKPTNEITKVYPARVKFRGFTEKDTEQGFITLTDYMKRNAPELFAETIEEVSPGITISEQAQ